MSDTPSGENELADPTPDVAPVSEVQQDASSAQVPATAGEGDAQSSSAQDPAVDPKEPETMADAIEAVLSATDKGEGDDAGEKPAEPDPAAEGDKGEAEKQGAEATADNGKDNDDPTDEELKGYAPKVQKRIKQLLHQRNTHRREAETLRPDAEHYRNIRQFMAENDLADREVADLFKVGALLKSNDPVRLTAALEMIEPIYQNLLALSGRAVADDLREKVDAGELTEDMARQLTQHRQRAQIAERGVQRVQQRVDTQAAVQTAQAIRDAVAAWWENVKKSDPDLGAKTAAFQDAALAIVARRGQPKTPEEAVAYAQEALERVNSFVSAARPAPKPTRPSPGAGSSSSRAPAAAAANSMLEAVTQALRAG